MNKKTGKTDVIGESAVINMHVKDDTDFLSVFSENETPVISGEVAEFIEAGARKAFPSEALTLRITGDCIDENERRIYKAAIKEYYSEKHEEVRRELRVYNKIALILAVLGVMVLSFCILFESITENRLWTEVIDIVAWVLIWEAVDIKFFKTRELIMKRRSYLKLSSMEIEYVSSGSDVR